MPTQAVELLILGAGWTSTFLIPLLKSNKVSFAATSRDGREGTIPFNFDPSSKNVEQYESLPDAMTVLITFPVTENVKALLDGYHETRSGTIGRDSSAVNWIQLGSTGSFVKVSRVLLFSYRCSYMEGPILTDCRLGGSTRRRGVCSQNRSGKRTFQARICYCLAPRWTLGRKEESGPLGSEDCTK